MPRVHVQSGVWSQEERDACEHQADRDWDRGGGGCCAAGRAPGPSLPGASEGRSAGPGAKTLVCGGRSGPDLGRQDKLHEGAMDEEIGEHPWQLHTFKV